MYWNHRNEMICLAYTANKFMLVQRGYLIEARVVITMEMLVRGISQRTDFLKDKLAKYVVCAG